MGKWDGIDSNEDALGACQIVFENKKGVRNDIKGK